MLGSQKSRRRKNDRHQRRSAGRLPEKSIRTVLESTALTSGKRCSCTGAGPGRSLPQPRNSNAAQSPCTRSRPKITGTIALTRCWTLPGRKAKTRRQGRSLPMSALPNKSYQRSPKRLCTKMLISKLIPGPGSMSPDISMNRKAACRSASGRK